MSQAGISTESCVFSVAPCLQWLENQIDFKAAIIKAPVSNSETHSLHVQNWKATLRTNGGYGWCIPVHSQQTLVYGLWDWGVDVSYLVTYTLKFLHIFLSLGQSHASHMLPWLQKKMLTPYLDLSQTDFQLRGLDLQIQKFLGLNFDFIAIWLWA